MTASLSCPGCDCENEALALSLAEMRRTWPDVAKILTEFGVSVRCDDKPCRQFGSCPRLDGVDVAVATDDCDLIRAEFDGTARLSREWR